MGTCKLLSVRCVKVSGLLNATAVTYNKKKQDNGSQLSCFIKIVDRSTKLVVNGKILCMMKTSNSEDALTGHLAAVVHVYMSTIKRRCHDQNLRGFTNLNTKRLCFFSFN